MHVRCDATCTDISLFLSFYMKYNISIYNQFEIPFFIKGEVMEKKLLAKVRSQKKTDIIWEFFPTWGGGVFPNPTTFVNLPSIFLYAKFILRC